MDKLNKASRRFVLKSVGAGIGAVTSTTTAKSLEDDSVETLEQDRKRALEIGKRGGFEREREYLEEKGYEVGTKHFEADLVTSTSGEELSTLRIDDPSGDGIKFDILSARAIGSDVYTVSLHWTYKFHGEAGCPTFGACDVRSWEDGQFAPNTSDSFGTDPNDAVGIFLEGYEGVSWELANQNYRSDTFTTGYAELDTVNSNAQSGKIGFRIDDAQAYQDWAKQHDWFDGGIFGNSYGGEYEGEFDGGVAGVTVKPGQESIDPSLRRINFRYVHAWNSLNITTAIGFGPGMFGVTIQPEQEVEQVPIDHNEDYDLLRISENEMT